MKMIAGVMLIWSATALLIASEMSGSGRPNNFFIPGWVQAVAGVLLVVLGFFDGRGDRAADDHPAKK
jgi:hypothetical protein